MTLISIAVIFGGPEFNQFHPFHIGLMRIKSEIRAINPQDDGGVDMSLTSAGNVLVIYGFSCKGSLYSPPFYSITAKWLPRKKYMEVEIPFHNEWPSPESAVDTIIGKLLESLPIVEQTAKARKLDFDMEACQQALIDVHDRLKRSTE